MYESAIALILISLCRSIKVNEKSTRKDDNHGCYYGLGLLQ